MFCSPKFATDISPAFRSPGGAAGLDDVDIHDLRHSFASIAVSGGDSLYLVGKVLGHRQSGTTERPHARQSRRSRGEWRLKFAAPLADPDAPIEEKAPVAAEAA
jgi:integrase